jgi:hypothetical protein
MVSGVSHEPAKGLESWGYADEDDGRHRALGLLRALEST